MWLVWCMDNSNRLLRFSRAPWLAQFRGEVCLPCAPRHWGFSLHQIHYLEEIFFRTQNENLWICPRPMLKNRLFQFVNYLSWPGITRDSLLYQPKRNFFWLWDCKRLAHNIAGIVGLLSCVMWDSRILWIRPRDSSRGDQELRKDTPWIGDIFAKVTRMGIRYCKRCIIEPPIFV